MRFCEECDLETPARGNPDLFSEAHGESAFAGQWVAEGVEKVGEVSRKNGVQGFEKGFQKQTGDAAMQALVKTAVELFGELHPEVFVHNRVDEPREFTFLEREVVRVVDGHNAVECVVFQQAEGVENVGPFSGLELG